MLSLIVRIGRTYLLSRVRSRLPQHHCLIVPSLTLEIGRTCRNPVQAAPFFHKDAGGTCPNITTRVAPSTRSPSRSYLLLLETLIAPASALLSGRTFIMVFELSRSCLPSSSENGRSCLHVSVRQCLPSLEEAVALSRHHYTVLPSSSDQASRAFHYCVIPVAPVLRPAEIALSRHGWVGRACLEGFKIFAHLRGKT